MNEFQVWCKEILPFVKAAANGEVVEIKNDGDEWSEKLVCNLIRGIEYRIRPRTIKIGDFDVPEPMRVEPGYGVQYFVVETLSDTPAACQIWNGMDCEKRWLSMGLCHKSKESAIAHAKALVALTSAK